MVLIMICIISCSYVFLLKSCLKRMTNISCKKSGWRSHSLICTAVRCSGVMKTVFRPGKRVFLNRYTHDITLTYLLHGAKSFLRSQQFFKLVKNFPAFYGTRRFITALTSVHNLPLSWATSIQSIAPHPTSWRSILILFSTTPPSPK